MKNALLIFALLFGVTSHAAGRKYCIRVYCDKLTRTKILNDAETPHGRFLTAIYDSKSKSYIIDKDDFGAAQTYCENRFGNQPEKLYGTNADILESIAHWANVKTEAREVIKDERCELMEKK